jgi:hypothetical protein
MLSENLYLDESLKYVINKRKNIFPNDGFIFQLIKIENEKYKSMSFLPNKDGLIKFKNIIHF